MKFLLGIIVALAAGVGVAWLLSPRAEKDVLRGLARLRELKGNVHNWLWDRKNGK